MQQQISNHSAWVLAHPMQFPDLIPYDFYLFFCADERLTEVLLLQGHKKGSSVFKGVLLHSRL
jgi:hypothetical protein